MAESLIGSFSGHPLVDYGRAAITAFSNRNKPEDVTATDVEAFAEFLVRYYDTALLKKVFTVLWTTNWPINYSKIPKGATPEQRRAVGDIIVREAVLSKGDRRISLGQCAFCARTPSELLARERVPLLMGREPINCGLRGAAGGIPVCGQCSSAIMGLALAPLCSGKILAIVADQPTGTIEIARSTVSQLRLRATLVDAANEPPALKAPKSRVIDYLLQLERADVLPGGVTVYAFSNSGQGPSLDIYQLTKGIPAFLLRAGRLGTEHVWYRFMRFAGERNSDASPEERRYEPLELLFQMPQQSTVFTQRFLLPFARQLIGDSSEESVNAKDQLWRFITLFTEDVLMMDSDRFKAIQRLGDTLADLSIYDRGIPGQALRASKYAEVRALLLNAGRRWSAELGRPIVTLNDAALIFESADGPTQTWRLAWDFALIRMLERIADKPQVLETISSEELETPGDSEEADVA